MKELIKPTNLAESASTVEALGEQCDRYCEPPQTCNKHCTGQGTTNSSPVDDADILF